MSCFDGSTVLITGASSGIGEELARQLAPFAGCLLLTARRADRLEKLKKELARPGLIIHCFSADLSDPSSVPRLLEQVLATGEKVSFLINNAGLGDHGLFENSDWDRQQEMIDVNISALTRLTRAFIPDMIKCRRGAILNVGSIAGMIPIPHMAVYAATKAYVNSFSEALRIELKGTGVSVTALCPGPIRTEFFDRAERPNTKSAVPAPPAFMVPVEKAVGDALRAVELNHARVVPGWKVALVMAAATAIPLVLLRLALSTRGRDYAGH